MCLSEGLSGCDFKRHLCFNWSPKVYADAAFPLTCDFPRSLITLVRFKTRNTFVLTDNFSVRELRLQSLGLDLLSLGLNNSREEISYHGEETFAFCLNRIQLWLFFNRAITCHRCFYTGLFDRSELSTRSVLYLSWRFRSRCRI